MKNKNRTIIAITLLGLGLLIQGCSEKKGEGVVAVEPSSATGSAPTVVVSPSEEQLAGTKAYTAETCVVSGEELGGMGEPVVALIGDQQVKLCCDHCVPDLKKNPAKFLTKVGE